MLACLSIKAQTYTPTQENIEARQLFQDNKFGIFVHFGLYSMIGRGEWVMQNERISCANYSQQARYFNPVEFNADEWIKTVKAAGAKYITITTRHHDGFSLFDTQYSDYDITATPYKRDILAQLAEACRANGIKLCFYYSLLDWQHADYFPYGSTGTTIPDRPKNGDFKKYVEFMKNQLTELLTNYGEIGSIWFDGWWDNEKNPDWNFDSIYALIHSLQPACLVGNNHHTTPFAGEDFQMFERDLPGQNKAGYSGQQEISHLPLETCETMNKNWGYSFTDNDFKSTKTLLQLLINAAGNNANLLLNVGPTGGGKFPEQSVRALMEMGKWLEKNGETIYGTRGAIVKDKTWGTATSKGNIIYLHILNKTENVVVVDLPNVKVKSAVFFEDKVKVHFRYINNTLVLEIPETRHNDVDLIVELKI